MFCFGKRFGADRRGAAAAEFALTIGLLILPLLNVVDLGVYVYQRMSLDNAAQVAAQAAWSTCNLSNYIPATTKCPGLTAAINAAASSTPLGTLTPTTSEGYYCVNSAGALVSVASSSSCTSVKPGSTDKPGDYIQVTTSFSYSPVFAGVTVAGLLTTPITRTAWMRLL